MHLWARNADDKTRPLRLRRCCRCSRCSRWSRRWAGSGVTSRLASLGGGHENATAVSSTGVAVGIDDNAALREGAPTR